MNERKAQNLTAWAFLLPGLLGLVLLYLLPFASIFYLSLTRWNLFTAPHWVGLSNFADLLQDAEFRAALGQTALVVLFSVPASLAIGLALALLVDQPLRGARFFRAVYFSPAILYTIALAVVVGLVMRVIEQGLAGWSGAGMGLAQGLAGLIKAHRLLIDLVLITVYKWAGFDMVIFLGGLRQVPPELLDAAQVDGAGKWQRFRYITLPLLAPALLFAAAITTLLTATAFDQGYAFGGESGSTSLVVVFIYQQLFQGFGEPKGGYAAAAGLVLALLLVGAVLLQWRFMKGRLQAASGGIRA